MKGNYFNAIYGPKLLKWNKILLQICQFLTVIEPLFFIAVKTPTFAVQAKRGKGHVTNYNWKDRTKGTQTITTNLGCKAQ